MITTLFFKAWQQWSAWSASEGPPLTSPKWGTWGYTTCFSDGEGWWSRNGSWIWRWTSLPGAYSRACTFATAQNCCLSLCIRFWVWKFASYIGSSQRNTWIWWWRCVYRYLWPYSSTISLCNRNPTSSFWAEKEKPLHSRGNEALLLG